MLAVHVVDHPLLARELTVLRDAATGLEAFRKALAEAAAMLAYEALRDTEVARVTVRTPLEETTGTALARPVMVVAVLRAGLGMVDGFLRFVPGAAVAHLGMRRNEETLQPEDYDEPLPAGALDRELDERGCIRPGLGDAGDRLFGTE